MKGGMLCCARRIPIQAKSARRRKGGKRGKCAIKRCPKAAFKTMGNDKIHMSTVCLERHTTILQKLILCNKIFLKDNRMLGNGRTIGIL